MSASPQRCAEHALDLIATIGVDATAEDPRFAELRAALSTLMSVLPTSRSTVHRASKACSVATEHIVNGSIVAGWGVPAINSTLACIHSALAAPDEIMNRAVEGATYELETLFPVPRAPDVSVDNLRRPRRAGQ